MHKASGQVYELDAISMFPSKLDGEDSAAKLFPADGSVPECSLLQNGEGCPEGLCLLPAGGCKLYSWCGFTDFLQARSMQLQAAGKDPLIFCGPGDTDMLCIRDDPLRAGLFKSAHVDYGARAVGTVLGNHFGSQVDNV